MRKILIEGLVIVILWVAFWNIIESIVDRIAGEDKAVRIVTYFILALFGLLMLWILEVAIEDDAPI
jgi:hypothetical protein